MLMLFGFLRGLRRLAGDWRSVREDRKTQPADCEQ
jgi:hypothetical protein